ncbi:MAG: PhzF family phenazine biosynthesis protein [Chloroflexi bacterium]|nr:PhzF family phenazine biosynthesis protein [Chloroflexota bacterium]
MTRRLRFRQVDVFTETPLCGNPLAVFPDASELSDDEMQALAREMNLSETAFLLPPTEVGARAGAVARVRIFTPGMELPFAGHPVVGTAWLLADEDRLGSADDRGAVILEVASGPLELHVERTEERPGRVTLLLHDAEIGERLDEDGLDELCEALEVPPTQIGWRSGGRKRKARPMVVSTGLPHLIVPFADRGVLMEVDHERRSYVAEICHSLGCDSAALVAAGGSGAIPGADVTVRLFDAGALRIDADPATGAAAGPICVFLGMLGPTRDATHRVVIEQGTEVGRPSRLEAAVDFGPDGAPGEVRVTGAVVPIIEGWVTLP